MSTISLMKVILGSRIMVRAFASGLMNDFAEVSGQRLRDLKSSQARVGYNRFSEELQAYEISSTSIIVTLFEKTLSHLNICFHIKVS